MSTTTFLKSRHKRLVELVATNVDVLLGWTLLENEALRAELALWKDRFLEIERMLRGTESASCRSTGLVRGPNMAGSKR